MSIVAPLPNKEARTRVQTPVHRKLVAFRRAWPVGLLLIAPGMFSVDALLPRSQLLHATGLNLDVAYEPTAYLHKPTTVSLSTMSVFGTKGHFSVRAGKRLLENFTISDISPQPIATEVDGDQSIFIFSTGGKDAVKITLVPKTVGRTAATLQYGLDPPVPFSITTVP